MSSSPKPGMNLAAEAHEKTATAETYPADFVRLFVKGVEQVAELQKKALELAARQNMELIENYKKAARSVPTVVCRVEAAEHALERYVAAQKIIIDQMVEQTSVMVESANEQNKPISKLTLDFADMIERSIERASELEQKALNVVRQQVKTIGKAKKTAA